MLFSHDTGNLHDNPSGWVGFMVWLVCTAIGIAIRIVELYVFPLMPNWVEIDHIVLFLMHVFSAISLIIGIIVGLVTLQDKLTARKK